MMWLKLGDNKKQTYIELRLYAPKNEKIVLEFQPLRMSKEPDWNPAWEEWHCYRTPLRVYKQDYKLLLEHFNKIYPTKDAFDGTEENAFDVCFSNWIGKDDWLNIIFDIEQQLEDHSEEKKHFLEDFLKWLKEALYYTSIIVVEGNQ